MKDGEASHSQAPGGVFSGTTASEILASAHKDFSLVVWRTVQDKVRVFASVWVFAKSVEESASETCPLEGLQELFRDDFVRVDVLHV